MRKIREAGKISLPLKKACLKEQVQKNWVACLVEEELDFFVFPHRRSTVIRSKEADFHPL